MTKRPFKDIFEYRADDGKTFYDKDGVHIGPLFYASTNRGIIEKEYGTIYKEFQL